MNAGRPAIALAGSVSARATSRSAAAIYSASGASTPFERLANRRRDVQLALVRQRGAEFFGVLPHLGLDVGHAEAGCGTRAVRAASTSARSASCIMSADMCVRIMSPSTSASVSAVGQRRGCPEVRRRRTQATSANIETVPAKAF